MKFRHLLMAAALALPVCASAKPAYPGVLTKHNPDGSVIQIRMYGDEHFSYVTDLDNNLLEYNAEGCLVPVMQAGSKVQATADAIEALRATNAENMRQFRKAKGMPAPALKPTADEFGQTTFNTITDKMHSLVVLVEFSDVKFSRTDIREYITRMLNEEGFNECPSSNYRTFGSARDYFIQCSGGLFKPTFDVSPIVTLPKTSAYYTGTGNAGNSKYAHADEAFIYAVQQLEDQLDFKIYDSDNDGIIDNIYFLYAGYGQADTQDPNYIWPHQGELGYYNCRPDGVLFNSYACSNELNGGRHYISKDKAIDGIGTFCHEFSHVIGLPDLYDPKYKVQTTPAYWSVLDKGPYSGDGYCPPLMSGYERWMLRWVDYEKAVDNTEYKLSNAYNEGVKPIKIPVKRPDNGREFANEYFVLESRSQTGFDTYLPDEGLLIWHINYDKAKWDGNATNSTQDELGVQLVTADGSANHWLGNINNYAEKAAWPGTFIDNTMITPVTEITTNTYHRLAHKTNNTFITNIAYDNNKKISTFEYNVYTESPTDVVTGMTATRLEGDDTVVLEWNPVEGATNYMLTVSRTNSSGTVFYEDGLKEKTVGNVTRFELPLSSSKMNFTYEWYVRVVKGVPSEKIARMQSFVGNSLPTSGIDDIVADFDEASIYGTEGAIVAPQGAEIYNLGGVRVAATDLPAGIYVVRYAGKAVKVMVK